ncbi:proteasome-type protease [Pseudaestuariivita atlantica]|uniref:Peptidase n=1 Tax=Pseudaestuariivita atlantica TaxID=1317121 RepID=A0A0L1JMZ0_9RHOB|nr:proteasome-type protease [Pseudaestuariivita atlantica]KNG93121.1 peptidase [Pseudaestuariivita atlantica]
MTYCVALALDAGIVCMSDTRTNAGVDNISTFRKMHTWEEPGERALVLMTAGNLATTQAVVSLLEERMKAPEDRDPSILRAPSMFQVARIVGDTLKEVIVDQAGQDGGPGADAFGATLIVAGQIGGGPMRMFLVYPEGNFIEASDDTPFFQIGETKYGRPILVRALEAGMSFENAVKLLMVSFDSTIKANLSVDAPLDVQILPRDALALGKSWRIEANDPYFRQLSESWGAALKQAFYSLPDFDLDAIPD